MESTFQLYVVAKVIADSSKVSMVKLPTGSGKSFIAYLLAMHYQSYG